VGFHSEPLPETGTYFAVVDPYKVASARLLLTLSADVIGQLSTEGPSVPVALRRPGQQARLAFQASAGDLISIGLTQVAVGGSGCCLEAFLIGPDGETLAAEGSISTSGSAMHSRPLPVSGTYEAVVDPGGLGTGSFSLTLSRDLSGSATIGGPPVAIRLARAGQLMHLHVDGTAGQSVRITLTEVVVGSRNCCAEVTVLGPDGEKVAERESLEAKGGWIDIPSLPANGAYTIVLDPANAVTLSLSLRLGPGPASRTPASEYGAAPASIRITHPRPSAPKT
jgi:hypothetical protein